MFNAIRLSVIVLVILCLFFVVHYLSYNDVLDEHERYCLMVEEGHWPDYREIFEIEC